MILPLKDEVPTRTFPFVTLALIAANVALFLRQMLLPPALQERMIGALALIPYELTHVAPAHPSLLAYNLVTLITSMFVHGSILHLVGNLLYLWIFGNNIEDVMGHSRFLVFYLLCGIAGAATQIAVQPASRVPMIGASGAISGVLGAYIVMFPAARVLTLVFLFFFVRIVPIPALIVLGLWLLIQMVSAGQLAPGGVAWFAHLGGFLAGLVAVVPFRRRRVRNSLY